jgi:GDP-L-fucose synthase
MKIWVTGSKGMVGNSFLNLLNQNHNNYLIKGTSSKELDLLNQDQVENFVQDFNPDIAVLTAARVGGVKSNMQYPGTFALENQLMQNIVLNSLIKSNVSKIVFIASSCVYPKNAINPLTPKMLMTGIPEPTNRWYAIAKLSMISALEGVEKQFGIKTTSLLPTNLYGPKDNFHLEDGHVIPSLLHRAIKNKLNGLENLTVWGDGSPLREVLYVEDFSHAILTVIEKDPVENVVNVGSGEELSIREIALKIKNLVGLTGELIFETDKPNGINRKYLNSDLIRSLGWSPKYDFESGLSITHKWVVNNFGELRIQGVNK